MPEALPEPSSGPDPRPEDSADGVSVALEVLLDTDEGVASAGDWLPSSAFLAAWAQRALGGAGRGTGGGSGRDSGEAAGRGEGPAATLELSVRLVGRETMRALNRDWRGRDRPTNVLSFPADMPPMPSGLLALGDLVLCPGVVRDEALTQGKSPEAHWAHLIVHGVLHLCGFDHVDEAAAERMEALESRLLSERGIPDPYGAPLPPR